MKKVRKLVAGLDEVNEERCVEWILDLVCRNGSIERCLEKLWAARLKE